MLAGAHRVSRLWEHLMQQRNGKWRERDSKWNKETEFNEGGPERWRSEREAQDPAAL